MKVLIGGAWVYANGPLHIGHIAGLLPADVIARYYRSKGEEVCYVSGSDCHGTPITIRAKAEGKSPEEISDDYHERFIQGFNYLGFSYDNYGKTSSEEHKNFCTDFHQTLYAGKHTYEKKAPEAYCPTCQKTLSDRLVVGQCPVCGKVAKGDQCDHCGHILTPSELVNPWCETCHAEPIFTNEKQLYLGVSHFFKPLSDQCKKGSASGWRSNAVKFTNRYIREGLRDRAITRTLDWGIGVPKAGFEDKKIYIWAENVLGYLSGCKAYSDEKGIDHHDFWQEDSRQYYVHGKDNIPFHTIILPSLQLAHGGYPKLPDHIISSEYLTLEGSKISTSENWAVWIDDLIGQYHPDAIRYFLLANNPEKRDGDFTFREFRYANNSELLGGYGNFIHRTLSIIEKNYGKSLPQADVDQALDTRIQLTYKEIGALIEDGEIKKAIRKVFELVKTSNKYFDERKPWIDVKVNRERADETLVNCLFLIQNLANLLEPFLPFSSREVLGWLGVEPTWEVQYPDLSQLLPEYHLLFQRLEEDVVLKRQA